MRVILVPQILNTRYFFGRCTALQFQQYILQSTAFLLAAMHSNGTKCPLTPQASKLLCLLNCPVTRCKIYTNLSCSPLVHHHNKSLALNLYPNDRQFKCIPPAHTVYIGHAGIMIIAGRRKSFFFF